MPHEIAHSILIFKQRMQLHLQESLKALLESHYIRFLIHQPGLKENKDSFQSIFSSKIFLIFNSRETNQELCIVQAIFLPLAETSFCSGTHSCMKRPLMQKGE